jgi:hypothetical protein
VLWVDVDKLDIKKGGSVLILDPDNIELVAKVSGKFKKVEKSQL